MIASIIILFLVWIATIIFWASEKDRYENAVEVLRINHANALQDAKLYRDDYSREQTKRIVELEDKLGQAAPEKDELVIKLKSEVNDQRKELKLKGSQIDSLANTVKSLTSQVDNNNTTIQSQKDEIITLKKQVDAVNSIANSVKKDRRTLDLKMSEFQAREAVQSREIDSFKSQKAQNGLEHKNLLATVTRTSEERLSTYKKELNDQLEFRITEIQSVYKVKFEEAIERVKQEALASVFNFDSKYDKSDFELNMSKRINEKRDEELSKAEWLGVVNNKLLEFKDLKLEVKESIMNVAARIDTEANGRALTTKDILNIINQQGWDVATKVEAVKYLISDESKNRHINVVELSSALNQGFTDVGSKFVEVKRDIAIESQKATNMSIELKSYIDNNLRVLSKSVDDKFMAVTLLVGEVRSEFSREINRVDREKQEVLYALESMENTLGSFKLQIDGILFVAEKNSWAAQKTQQEIELKYQSFQNNVEAHRNFIDTATEKLDNHFGSMTNQINTAKVGLDRAALEIYHKAQEVANQGVGVNMLIEQHQRMKESLIKEIDFREALIDQKMQNRQERLNHGQEVMQLDNSIYGLRNEVQYRKEKIGTLEEVIQNYKRYGN